MEASYVIYARPAEVGDPPVGTVIAADMASAHRKARRIWKIGYELKLVVAWADRRQG